MKLRSVPGIDLRPSNDNGGHYFLNLETNKCIHSYNWDELPTSDMAIKRVHEIAIQENQPIISNGELRYEWSDGEMNAEYDL